MIRVILRNAGINPRRLAAAWRGWRRYTQERDSFRILAANHEIVWGKELPILTEWEESSGTLGAYFLQDQLVARWIHESNPVRHVDIGSRIDGFIGSLSVFRKVDVVDIRPQPIPVHNVSFHQMDLMNELSEDWRVCTDSLSCLHTIEHFGLGRYGDPLDPLGHLKGLAQLKRMAKPGGMFYLSAPIGPERVEFNAHRVFSPQSMIQWFEKGWRIEKCGVIDDSNRIMEDGGADLLASFKGNLGVGIIAARKSP